ncbi:phage terminase large subunit [Bacillus sp. JJ722]|uniref:phage terminase large subunit n=1 Tax=Bacillus sp. JJ722 TaxID=3122973 RepID=UPI00300073A6
MNGKWIKRDERAELIDTYSQLIGAMLERKKDGTLLDSEYEELAEHIDEFERLKRIHRAEDDLMYFCIEYFSESGNPENLGNWDGFDVIKAEDAVAFHREICGIIDDISNVNTNGKVAVAAPRSHGKSTYLSRATPLREVIYRKRRYIMIISETPNVAAANLSWISGQLKTNKKLREDFGPLLSPKGNEKDNSMEFIAWEQRGEEQRDLALVQAASTGGAIRGRNWNGVRPDLIVCDDLEDARPGGNASTKEQREKLKEWFSSSVIPLGDAKGKRTAFVYMGTIVHIDSLLNHVIHNDPDFNATLFSAIIEEPVRNDLWEQCRSIYNDITLEKKQRESKAREFYEANREQMDEGVEVLWEEAQPIWRLYTWKWNHGSKAFNTEYQNKPRDEESQIFDPETFRYYDESDLLDTYGREMSLEYYAFWDIATGKSSRSDYNAIVTVGINRTTGVIFIKDAWAKKCPAHEALNVAVDKIKEYEHRVFLIETIGVGHDFYRQLRERLSKERIFRTKLKPITHYSSNKEKRIEALEPICESGFLRFNKKHSLLLEQLEQFPDGKHDDLADALSGVVDQIGSGKRRQVFSKKPANM